MKSLVLLVAWITVQVALFAYGFVYIRQSLNLYKETNAGPRAAHPEQGWDLNIHITRRWIDLALLLLPVCRNLMSLLRSTALGKIIPFDESQRMHIYLAYSTLFFTFVHVNAHYNNFFQVQLMLNLMKTWEAHYTIWAGITGHIMLVLMLFIFATAHKQIRTLHYEFFWYTHSLGVLFYLVLAMHAFGCFVKSADTGECKGYMTDNAYGAYRFELVGLSIYILELIARHYRASKQAIHHPGKTMEIQFEKPSLSYMPGQYVYVNIPAVWHPFTITSAPEEGYVSVHMRIVGDWTGQVLALFEAYQANMSTSSLISSQMPPKLRIDGPYGSPAQEFQDYEHSIFIAGGIGVTPAAGLLKSILYKYKRKSPMVLQKILFVWVSRDKDEFSWFSSLINDLENKLPRSLFNVQVYLTEKLTIDEIQNVTIRDNLDIDPITELTLSRCFYGRPNWHKIFKDVSLEVSGAVEKKVGVFYCGPAPLGDLLKKFSASSSSQKLEFVFKREQF